MPEPKSTHLPEVSGGVTAVGTTGIAIVDTGLREIQAVSAMLKANSITANEESHVIANWTEGSPKVTFKVYKGGTGSGTIGDSAVNIVWMAFGK
jgi:hypothetical protein